MRTLKYIKLLLPVVVALTLIGCGEDQATNASLGDDATAQIEKEENSELGKKGPKNKCKKKDEPCGATAQVAHELVVKVSDGDTTAVVEQICAYSSATNSVCGWSVSPFNENFRNFFVELFDTQDNPTITLNVDTAYILTTATSSNAIYYFWSVGDLDQKADLDIVSSSQTWRNLVNNHDADFELVSTELTNLTVGTPRYKGLPVALNWGADWAGPNGLTYPTFFVSKGSVKIVEPGKADSLITSTVAYHATNGTAFYSWIPSREYSSIKIKVEDNNSNDFIVSSVFNVTIKPLETEINGPSSLEQGVQGTWSADEGTMGGITPYTYDWDYLFICNEASVTPQVETCDTWNQGGTSFSWQKSVSGAEFDMKIRLTVTDSDSPTSQVIKFLIVDIFPSP